jgi:ppGpp synthetase/RelA/SpoT-type nucleotidyltranferase
MMMYFQTILAKRTQIMFTANFMDLYKYTLKSMKHINNKFIRKKTNVSYKKMSHGDGLTPLPPWEPFGCLN